MRDKQDKNSINWTVRAKNPVFWAQVLLSVLTPALACLGMSLEDLTTWSAVGDVVESAYSNPYLLGLVLVSVFNTLTDPTVSGIGDSDLAKSYSKPKKKHE